MGLPGAKATLRRDMRARLGSLDAEAIAAASAAIVSRLAAWEGYRRAEALLLPLPLPGEPDLTPLAIAALEAGKRLCLPRVDWTARTMKAAIVARLDALVTGRYGLREPPADAAACDAKDVALVLVPGIAFDASGGRLGRGAGFYDRFLAAEGFAGCSCGVCFDFQVVERVPRGPMDVPVAAVMTDQRLIVPERPAEPG